MPSLILIMGMPASGKTAFSKTMEGRKLRIADFEAAAEGEGGSGGIGNLAADLALEAAKYYLRTGETVVADGGFLSQEERALWVAAAEEAGASPKLYWLDVSFEFLKERVHERNKTAAEGKKIAVFHLAKMARELETPSAQEGFAEIHRLTEDELF